VIENKLFRKVFMPKKDGVSGAFRILYHFGFCAASILGNGKVLPMHAFKAYGAVEV
jgi:hypothetical protein